MRGSFLKRFYIYQKERFPFAAHGILIASFTFSAISYSRICRGVEGFIPWPAYLPGVFITITLFFLLRILDEFKDKEDDAKYRKYLPVPRGLISLEELKIAGWVTVAIQLIVIWGLQPKMAGLYAIAIIYILLMYVEFFIPKFLRKKQMLYVASHMLIIPLVDIYASGLDWLLEGARPHIGLLFFFGVSYMNGIVLEIGRKIRTPEKEEKGVVSYTHLYGTEWGTYYWIMALFFNLILSIAASAFGGFGWTATIILIVFFIGCSLPGWLFVRHKTEKLSKIIEYTSALWAVLMYLTLGGVPMLSQLISV